MAIFNSYVKLPEGIIIGVIIPTMITTIQVIHGYTVTAVVLY